MFALCGSINFLCHVILSLCDNATWDTYLILLGSDCETQIASDDDGCGEVGGQSEINGTLGSGTYFLVVDGWSATSEGEYTLSVSATGSDRTSGVFQPSVTDENKLNNLMEESIKKEKKEEKTE